MRCQSAVRRNNRRIYRRVRGQSLEALRRTLRHVAAGAFLIVHEDQLLSSSRPLVGYQSLTPLGVEMQIEMAFGQEVVERFKQSALTTLELHHINEWLAWSVRCGK